VKKVVFVIKSKGSLKNFKIRSGLYSGLGPKIYIKNEIKISLNCPFKRRSYNLEYASAFTIPVRSAKGKFRNVQRQLEANQINERKKIRMVD
jgi:hypothetical protein